MLTARSAAPQYGTPPLVEQPLPRTELRQRVLQRRRRRRRQPAARAAASHGTPQHRARLLRAPGLRGGTTLSGGVCDGGTSLIIYEPSIARAHANQFTPIA